MTDAEARFAARLAEDIERALGVGIAVDDLVLDVDEGIARAVATLLVDGRVEHVEVTGPDVAGLYGPLMRRAARLRLGAAWWQIAGPV